MQNMQSGGARGLELRTAALGFGSNKDRFSSCRPEFPTCVGDMVASIAAFQAIDPGLIIGQRVSLSSGGTPFVIRTLDILSLGFGPNKDHFSSCRSAFTTCVGGIVASIAPFQAVNPGLIPGQRI